MTKILTVVFLFITFLSYGQTAGKIHKTKEQMDKICDMFVQDFTDGKIADAIDLLKENSVMGISSLDTLQMKIQYQMKNIITPQYGKMISSEFVKESKIKDFIARRFYIIRLTDFYLKSDFTLYNSGDGWAITSFHYNENIDELFTN